MNDIFTGKSNNPEKAEGWRVKVEEEGRVSTESSPGG